ALAIPHARTDSNLVYVRSVTTVPGTDLIAAGGYQHVYFCRRSGQTCGSSIAIPDQPFSLEATDGRLLWTGDQSYGELTIPEFARPTPTMSAVERVAGCSVVDGALVRRTDSV